MATAPEPESIPSSSTKEEKRPPIEPLRLPSMEEIRGQDIWNNCAVRSVVSGVMGNKKSFFFDFSEFLFMSAKQQFIYQAKQMGRRSYSSAKTFAIMGLIFSAVECVVEKARAKHDTTNSAIAGCVTGGALSAKACIPLIIARAYASFGLAACPLS
ncbi:hypothetical protein GIB67_017032 [Kingdonia uniflora]|uniref:Mitochondrial import inner membrane translocase subunit TIM22 n=1 Tax=Kingdonia uniflora TaxID=39325 RepID=A0A7J7NC35_9MAGN|nr:hypothetical protein GIB67_017032 [Kingdonia uniflora]